MQRAIAVTVVSTVTTTDDYGDSTSTETRSLVPGVLFAPRSSQERADSRAPAVITGGTLYKSGPGLTVDHDDTIEIADVHPSIDGAWQVEGDPGYWGAGTEVAIKRAGA